MSYAATTALPATRSSADDVWLLTARFLMVLLFIVSGMEKLLGPTDFAHMIATRAGVPLAPVMTWIVIGFELGCAFAILAGFQTRTVCLLLAVYILILGPWFHQFWTYRWADNPQLRQMMMDDFFHHTTMAGGFIALAVAGPGRFSLDANGRRA